MLSASYCLSDPTERVFTFEVGESGNFTVLIMKLKILILVINQINAQNLVL